MQSITIKNSLKLVFATYVFFFICQILAAKEKPNILFIAVDDLKPNIGCFGDTLAITPNIDQIASKGIIFTKNYCQQAVCAPSRASLLTSRYPDQTQVWDLQTLIRDKTPDIITLPQHFKENGYITSGVGKIFDSRSVDKNNDTQSWNSYGNPYQDKYYDQTTGKPKYYYATQHAKDTIELLENEAVQKGLNKKDYIQKNYWPSTENADVPYNAYIDGAIAQSGVELMTSLNQSGKPFFLAVGFHRPHLPFNAPKQFWDLYQRSQFQKAAFQEWSQNGPSLAYHNSGELRSYTDIPANGNISNEKQLELIHAYYAATSYIDFCIGLLSAKLTELGISENTVIVLWGDHGWHLGDHNLWCKHSNFEQATRAPLIISFPGQSNKGTKYNYPTEFTDIAPTLCQLAGIKVPVDFEGQSLLPAFNNITKPIRETAISQYPRWDSGTKYMGYSVRTERFRYTKWVNSSTKEHYKNELYDYQNDSLETINEAGSPDFKDVVSHLDSIVSIRIFNPSTQKKVQININKINASHDTIPVYFSKVTLEDKWEYSNQSGEVVFTHLPGYYSFQVEKEGFQNVATNFELKNDTVIEIVIQKISSSPTNFHGPDIKFWPNPFDKKLMVKTTHFNTQLSICSERGKTLVSKTVKFPEEIVFNTEKFKSGIYLLNISNQTKSKVYKILKTN